MRTLACMAAALAVALSPAQAAAQGATPASIERLLEAKQTEQLLKSMLQSVAALQDEQFARMLSSLKTEEAKTKALAVRERMAVILADELGYAKMKPLMVELFERTYTEDEVRALLEFYESPTGRKYLEKQPQLMRESMAAMQRRMLPMRQRIKTEIDEIMRQ